mgnify:CR=1 FL=1
MRNIGFCSLFIIFLYSATSAQVTESDRLFKMATDFVKERKYSDAVSIFRELAKNDEHDAQYNLAFLISAGKGITKNYSEALFWAFLSQLGKIEKAEELTEDLIDIVNPYAAMLNPSGFGQSGDEMDEEEGEGVDEGHEYEGAM